MSNCGCNTPIPCKSSVQVDCNNMYECLNNLLNMIDPKCLSDINTWKGLPLVDKLTLLINQSCNSVSTCSAPVITLQPVGATIDAGQSYTFNVVATGTVPITYQWIKDGLSIADATSSSYTVNSASTTDEGDYGVIISNSCGSVASTSVSLTVNVLQSQFTAYWGWLDTPLTDGDTSVLQRNAQFNNNGTVTADYSSNNEFKILVMVEPSSQPLKTIWYGSVDNNGTIGGASDLFGTPLIVGSNRIYNTQYATLQTDTPLQFKVI